MPDFTALRLAYIGAPEASIGVISLPLPRSATDLCLDWDFRAERVVGWWQRHRQPRRVLTYVCNPEGPLPATLGVRQDPMGVHQTPLAWPWTSTLRPTLARLPFKPRPYNKVADLRGVPTEDCTTMCYALELAYQGRTLTLECGATAPDGSGAHHWQNVQIDRLWTDGFAEGLRVGGVIFNGDTYLWADAYLVLFANGVVDLAVHFHVTRLHLDAEDFNGLPFVRLGGSAVSPQDHTLPRGDMRFQLGQVSVNLADSAALCSEAHPARLVADGASQLWWPFERVINPQLREAPPRHWPVGFARTLPFQLSLSEAAPVIGRYQAPAWWYAQCEELWLGDYLPVRGRLAPVGEMTAEHLLKTMHHGAFDAGNAEHGNDGDAGVGTMYNYYATGRPEFLAGALRYCRYWADIAVDHRDFTVHQWIGGWPWKTCAYTKFRDVLMGWLETGDPWLLDTVEQVAETHWGWFRANWPRNSIGRDAFEVGGWALLWRYLASERAHERTAEYVRMIGEVLRDRGVVGGQMGAGPHPGYHASLYMTGVVMVSLLEVAEAARNHGDEALIETLTPMLKPLHQHYMREDVELFPSSWGHPVKWSAEQWASWFAHGARIYTAAAHLAPAEAALWHAGRSRGYERATQPQAEWASTGRLGTHFITPWVHDALLLAARWDAGKLRLQPIAGPEHWPASQVIATPVGPVTLTLAAGKAAWQLTVTAPALLAWSLKLGKTQRRGTGTATVRLPLAKG